MQVPANPYGSQPVVAPASNAVAPPRTSDPRMAALGTLGMIGTYVVLRKKDALFKHRQQGQIVSILAALAVGKVISG